LFGPGSIDVDLTTTADCFFLYTDDGKKTFVAVTDGDLCTSSWNVWLGCLHKEKAHNDDDDDGVMKSLWRTPPFILETSALLLLLA
jgi:hypothetical protein